MSEEAQESLSAEEIEGEIFLLKNLTLQFRFSYVDKKLFLQEERWIQVNLFCVQL